MLKFSVPGGVLTLRSSKIIPLECTMVSRLEAQSSDVVTRSENKKADALSKIASTSFAHLTKQVLVEELSEKSINVAELLAVVEEEGDTWITPIYNYLTEETLPAEKEKARAIRHKSGRYTVANGSLYKKSYLGPCMYAGTRSVVAKAIRTGYYWPIMHADARKLIRECQDCQGIDIAGPFPEGPGKVKFLIVEMDYFTKWIEAKPVATITGNQRQPFKDWCEKLCIRQRFAFVKHPQANSLVERANKSLGEGIKAQLDERSKDWIEEVPHVLWAHRIMIKSSNGDTPFSLTYGMEAVILAEIEERREQAAIRKVRSKAKMEKYYNSKVRNTSFKPGDLVYRNNNASHAKDSEKLSPKW
ncbi:reverse transcriptase domain-containing protein [Tanacetum coccineum]